MAAREQKRVADGRGSPCALTALPLRGFSTHRGFTLVELVIVALLLSALAAAAVPLLTTNLEHHRATALARQIAADVRYAQSLAVLTGQQYRLAFSMTDQWYDVSVWSGGSWQLCAHPVSKKTWRVSVASGGPWTGLALKAAAFGGNAFVVFDKYGAPDNGGYVTFTLGALTRTVRVAPLSGRVTVE